MFALAPIFIATSALLTNCADVARTVFARRTGADFRITGAVHLAENNGDYSLLVADASGGAQVFSIRHQPDWQTIQNGDTLCISGTIVRTERDLGSVVAARCRSFHVIRHEPPPAPVSVSATQLASGRFDCRDVRTAGEIVEVFRDEIDLRYVYASLNCDGIAVYMTIRADEADEKRLRAQRGAHVEVTGLVTPGAANARRALVRTLSCTGLADIRTITPAPADPFAVPGVDPVLAVASDLSHTTGRRRIVGTVTAVFGSRRLLLLTDAGLTHNVRLANVPLPDCGDRIEAAGLPETDFYRINLADAEWRMAPGASAVLPPPTAVSPAKLLTDGQGRAQINPWLHGRPVRIEGVVIDKPVVGSAQKIVTLKDGDATLPIDITSAPDVLAQFSVGSRLAVTGICIVETEIGRTFAAFPHASGILLAPRTARDITVLAYPPWWTPGKFLILLAILVALLVLIFIRNRVLKAVIARKSQQLAQGKAAKIASEQRTAERTNLAVELHDSLSQNLSGVACQVAAARDAIALGQKETRSRLDAASQMLLSCRTELRRCLMDLRSDALEETDFPSAIRKVLAPIAPNIETAITFDVPRTGLKDTEAHAVLCIIRELVSNAIRHGRARHVDIGGSLEKATLRFSVRDDGAGFDPDDPSGPAEGHFGLEGVRARVKRLSGTFDIRSAPGEGTCATVTIRLTPPPGTNGKDRP